MSKIISFAPSLGFPPFACSCGTILRTEQEPYWLIQVINHPTQRTGHVRLSSDDPNEICPKCKKTLPVFCNSQEEAQKTCSDLNKEQLIDVSVFCLEGD